MNPSKLERLDAAIDAAAAGLAHGAKLAVRGGARVFEVAKPHVEAAAAAAAKHGAKVLDRLSAAHKAAAARERTKTGALIGAISIGLATLGAIVLGKML